MKIERLKKRKDFLALRRKQRYHTPLFVIESRMRSSSEDMSTSPRIGFTVSKKCGNAVKRNRIKRRLRAAIAECSPLIQPQRDYAIIARSACFDADFADIITALSTALQKVVKQDNSPYHSNKRSKHKKKRA